MTPSGGVKRSPSTPVLRLTSLLVLTAVALAVFVRGFLLTRVELSKFSACDDALAADWPGGGRPSSSGDCWGTPHYRRTALLLVDALRFDFVAPAQDAACDSSALGCTSKMPRLLALHQQSAGASHLARFTADPPTTTMQRLKGIFTGSLPTFLDIGSAFSATHVTEDNLFRQLSERGMRTAFVGDDTWEGLFPEHLTQAWPYPSMNVHDLHTVDRGVWQHLLPLLLAPEGEGSDGEHGAWEFLVGHTLGVDHAGHTYGVQSPEMDAKLNETDQKIAEAVEAAAALAGPGGVHEHTLLLVMGDHGQTLNGDHGGGTSEETDTVLLAFDLARLHKARNDAATTIQDNTPINTTSIITTSTTTTLAQLDLLPTLSLLLGLPIPFCSIGAISPELWALSTAALPPAQAHRSLRLAMERNSWQVRRYLEQYHGPSPGRFNRHRYSACTALYSAAEEATRAAREAAAGSEGVEEEEDGGQGVVEAHAAFLRSAAALAREQWTQFALLPMSIGLIALAALFTWHSRHQWSVASRDGPPGGELFAVTAAAAFNAAMLLSDSYIWEEPRVVLALLVCLATAHLALALRCQTDSSRSRSRPMLLANWAAVLAAARAMAACGHLTPQHRPVEVDSWGEAVAGLSSNGNDDTLAQSLSALPGGTSWLLVVLVGVGFWGAPELEKAAMRLGPAMAVALWHAVEDIADGDPDVSLHHLPLHLPPWLSPIGPLHLLPTVTAHILQLPLRLLAPRCVFLMSGVAILGALLDSASGRRSRPHMPPSLLSTELAWLLLPPLAMLYGRNGPLLASLAAVQLLGWSNIIRMRAQGDCGAGSLAWLPTAGGAILAVFGQHFFYCTGHTSQFAGLQYNAGFVGWDDFNYVRAGALLAANTFGPHVMTTLLVPQAALWCRASGPRDAAEAENRVRRHSDLRSDVHQVAGGYVGVRLLSLLFATFGAALHRRHLMAWSIFAPRFVFEAVTAAVTAAGLMVSIAGAGDDRSPPHN